MHLSLVFETYFKTCNNKDLVEMQLPGPMPISLYLPAALPLSQVAGSLGSRPHTMCHPGEPQLSQSAAL